MVKSLVQLHGLTNLNVSSCDEVTDEGLQSLALLMDLDSLNAVDCGITDEGITELQKVRGGNHAKLPLERISLWSLSCHVLMRSPGNINSFLRPCLSFAAIPGCSLIRPEFS